MFGWHVTWPPQVYDERTGARWEERGLQMGGPEGIAAAEELAITFSCKKGMLMHCNPRAGPPPRP